MSQGRTKPDYRHYVQQQLKSASKLTHTVVARYLDLDVKDHCLPFVLVQDGRLHKTRGSNCQNCMYPMSSA